VTDRLGVKRPSLCSTEGPSLRPDLLTLGRCGERRSRMDARPPFFTARSVLECRSPQRQAGGKVRTSAACYLAGMVIPSRKPPPEVTRMSSSCMKQPARVVATQRATKAIWPGNSGVGARQRPLILPKQPTPKENCFVHQPKRLPPRVKHRFLRNSPFGPIPTSPTSWVGPFH
jgi:hypothetical protein